MKYINTYHFSNRIFNGALKLKIETSLDEPSINIDSILELGLLPMLKIMVVLFIKKILLMN